MHEVSFRFHLATRRMARPGELAKHGWVGLVLLAIFWPLNWLLSGPRTYGCYLPLWWGLALTIDALCLRVRGMSLLRRNPREFLRMAMLSIPFWWMFEALNEWYARDWRFEGGNLFVSFPFGALGTLALSALLPVIFGSAELIGGAGCIHQLRRESAIHGHRPAGLLTFVIGLMLLDLISVWPHHWYVLIWLALFLTIDSINLWLGYPSLIATTVDGNWWPVLYLGLGGLVAGIFSEVWNYYSYPRWWYDVPFGNFWHVFELPILGYAVFPTVSWELYAIYHLVAGLRRSRSREDTHRRAAQM